MFETLNIWKGKDVEVQEDKKMSFFKEMLMSIKDFEKYDVFLKENIGQAFLYLAKIMLIYSLIVTILSVYSFATNLKSVADKFENQVMNLDYKDGTLIVNDNEKVEISELRPEVGKILINTADITDEEIDEAKNEIQNQGNGVLVLKNKLIILNSRLSSAQEVEYKTLFENYKIDTLNKDIIVDYYNQNNVSILISIALMMFVYTFIIYTFNVLIDCLALAILAFLTGKIAKVGLSFVASLNISIHAITLPLLLNMIYILVNFFTGFTIKYFQIMYTAIAYIYVITAILMLKSDLIKGLQKIKDVEEQVKEELKQREEEEREKDEVKRKDRESEKNEKGNEKEERPKPRIGNKPEGDNA